MLKSFLNFTAHVGTKAGVPILYFISEDGECWYDAQETLRQDTVKLCVYHNGYIVAWAHDASTLSPEDCSIYEVEASDVPDSIHTGQPHVYDAETGKISLRVMTVEEYRQEAETAVSGLMDIAIRKTTPLEDAEKLGVITPDELELLVKWRLYRVALMRLDLTKWPALELPKPPAE